MLKTKLIEDNVSCNFQMDQKYITRRCYKYSQDKALAKIKS